MRPWLGVALWAGWVRTRSDESENEPAGATAASISELVLQIAPDVAGLEGYPHGVHLRHTVDGIRVWPAESSWRNPRGEIGGDWVAWRNALTDDPEQWCKQVIESSAPVQWVLESVHVRRCDPLGANSSVATETGPVQGILLTICARSPAGASGDLLDQAAYPPRVVMFPVQFEGAVAGIAITRSDPLNHGVAHSDWRLMLQCAAPSRANCRERDGDPDLSALRQRLAPYFPRPDREVPRLPPFSSDDWPAFEAARKTQIDEALLPYWQRLAPAYVAALSTPFGADQEALSVAVEDWPHDFARQQTALYQLLEVSKLRMAWRSQARWQREQQPFFTDGMRRVAEELEREHQECSRPLAEIPLYQGFMRVSCQQLLCLPLAQHEAMFSASARYEPVEVDEATVTRLAHRIARLFNAPPLQSAELLNDAPSRHESIIWRTSQRGLTESMNSHGLYDRIFDEYGRPKEHLPGQIPGWRFDGFCGQLRVHLENGESWYVTVLGPSHFVASLYRMYGC